MDTGLPFKKLQSVPSRPSPKVFDADMINNWYMPIKNSKIDVKDYLLKKCQTQEERDRVEQEYVLFEQKNFIRVLQFLIYLVDTLRKNNIVWGVGSGSSVVSYCLLLIGVNKIILLIYNLKISEFLRYKVK